MKFFIIVLLFTLNAFSQISDRQKMSMEFNSLQPADYLAKAEMIFEKVVEFSEFKKLTASDAELLKGVLKTLVAFDQIDNSRTIVQVVTPSYFQNKALYKKIARTFSKEDQAILKDMFKMMDEMRSFPGNG